MDPVTNMKATATAMQQLLAGLTPEQMSLPTPCPGWTVADLLDHVSVNPYGFAGWADGIGAPPAGAGDAPAAQRYDDAIENMLNAYTAPGVLDKALVTPFGDIPGANVLAVCFADQLTHVWDLARALGRTVDVADDLADQATEVWKGFIVDPLRNGVTFAEPKEAGPSASALDRLAAFTGRDV